MNTGSTGHTIQARLAAALRAPLDPRVWSALVHEGYDKFDDDRGFRELVKQARYYSKLFQEPVTKPAQRIRRASRPRNKSSPRAPLKSARLTEPWHHKARCLAEAAAATAAQDAAVRKFREEVVGAELWSPERARAFIRARASSRPTSRVLLAFPNEDNGVESVKVERASEGGRLQQLAQALVSEHGWEDYQAVWFILTGLTPLSWPLKVEDVYLEDRLVAISVVAAPWMPARAVHDAFRRMQPRGATAGSRPLSERRAALYAFMCQRPPGTYRESLVKWNRAFPPWKYTDVRRFVRDTKAAQRHIQASAFRLDLA